MAFWSSCWPTATRCGRGWTLVEAGDIAFIVANVETYLQFTDLCGWTPDQ